MDWFNNRRLLDAIGYVPPAEFEKAYYRNREESADALDSRKYVSGKSGAIHPKHFHDE